MHMRLRFLALLIPLSIGLAACGGAVEHVDTVETVSAATAADIVAQGDHTVLDIRTPAEFAEGHLEGAVNIDFYEPDFATAIAALDRGGSYVVYCRSGNRSDAAMDLIRDLGFDDVHEIDGGILSWQAEGLSVVFG